jgi:hypothetical protein
MQKEYNGFVFIAAITMLLEHVRAVTASLQLQFVHA